LSIVIPKSLPPGGLGRADASKPDVRSTSDAQIVLVASRGIVRGFHQEQRMVA
jgi:hypothetical protein